MELCQMPGKIFKYNGERFGQERVKEYGKGVHGYEILKLSSTEHGEIPLEGKMMIKPFGNSWAETGMHHIDILQISENNFFSVFDGRTTV